MAVSVNIPDLILTLTVGLFIYSLIVILTVIFSALLSKSLFHFCFIADFSEICESSSGFFSLSRCQLFEDGFPAEILHLRDANCKGTVQNGRVEFHFDSIDLCGTDLVVSYTI